MNRPVTSTFSRDSADNSNAISVIMYATNHPHTYRHRQFPDNEAIKERLPYMNGLLTVGNARARAGKTARGLEKCACRCKSGAAPGTLGSLLVLFTYPQACPADHWYTSRRYLLFSFVSMYTRSIATSTSHRSHPRNVLAKISQDVRTVREVTTRLRKQESR